MIMTFPVPMLRGAAMAAAALALGACGHVELTHVPPGESLAVAMAKKPQLVRLPTPPPGATPQQASSPNGGMREGDKISHVAEAYSRGEFCLNAGKDDEALAAFLEVVKLDPSF